MSMTVSGEGHVFSEFDSGTGGVVVSDLLLSSKGSQGISVKVLQEVFD
jgi:hypothetical protein